MDIDLEGRVNNQLDHIKEVVATVCEVDVEPDGIAFNRTSIDASRIKEDADYEVSESSSTQPSRERDSDATRYRLRRWHYSGTHGH